MSYDSIIARAVHDELKSIEKIDVSAFPVGTGSKILKIEVDGRTYFTNEQSDPIEIPHIGYTLFRMREFILDSKHLKKYILDSYDVATAAEVILSICDELANKFQVKDDRSPEIYAQFAMFNVMIEWGNTWYDRLTTDPNHIKRICDLMRLMHVSDSLTAMKLHVRVGIKPIDINEQTLFKLQRHTYFTYILETLESNSDIFYTIVATWTVYEFDKFIDWSRNESR